MFLNICLTMLLLLLLGGQSVFVPTHSLIELMSVQHTHCKAALLLKQCCNISCFDCAASAAGWTRVLWLRSQMWMVGARWP